VWYLGNLSGSISIPAIGFGHGLSGWALFTAPGGAVRDGGTTVMLLGAALGVLGMARRFLKLSSFRRPFACTPDMGEWVCPLSSGNSASAARTTKRFPSPRCASATKDQ
jgi:hypothetical protein